MTTNSLRKLDKTEVQSKFCNYACQPLTKAIEDPVCFYFLGNKTVMYPKFEELFFLKLVLYLMVVQLHNLMRNLQSVT